MHYWRKGRGGVVRVDSVHSPVMTGSIELFVHALKRGGYISCSSICLSSCRTSSLCLLSRLLSVMFARVCKCSAWVGVRIYVCVSGGWWGEVHGVGNRGCISRHHCFPVPRDCLLAITFKKSHREKDARSCCCCDATTLLWQWIGR